MSNESFIDNVMDKLKRYIEFIKDDVVVWCEKNKYEGYDPERSYRVARSSVASMEQNGYSESDALDVLKHVADFDPRVSEDQAERIFKKYRGKYKEKYGK